MRREKEKKYHDQFKGVQLLYVSPCCFRQQLLRSCYPWARPHRFQQSIYRHIPLKFTDKYNKTPNKNLKLAIASYTLLGLVLVTQPPCLRYGPSTFNPHKERCQFKVAYYDSINQIESSFNMYTPNRVFCEENAFQQKLWNILITLFLDLWR